MRKDKMIRVALISIAIAVGNTSLCFAQRYSGPQDFHGAVKIPIPFPSSYPPLSTGMPWDVMKGYIGLDSLMHVQITQPQIDSIASAMTDSDSLRWALKYIYEMRDYDPIAFFQELNLFPRTGEYLSRVPRGIVDDALVRAGQAIPDSGRVLMALADVDAILQITVTDTSSVVDTTKPEGFNVCERVDGVVNDLIKGHNLPSCNYRIKSKGTQPTSASCVAFQYWRYWTNSIQIGGVYMTNRGTWLSPDSQYIVFLRFIGLGSDSSQAYATLSPGCAVSTLMGVYPIQNDILYDPNNDFGFGSGLTVENFKAQLQQKIQSITSYQ